VRDGTSGTAEQQGHVWYASGLTSVCNMAETGVRPTWKAAFGNPVTAARR